MRSLLRDNSSMGHVRLKNQYLIVAGYCCHVPLLLGPAFPPLQEPDPIAFSAMAVSTMGGASLYRFPPDHDFIRSSAVLIGIKAPRNASIYKIMYSQIL